MSTSENKIKRTLLATVVSAKMDKSAIVKMERKVKHPLYGKFVKKTTKLSIHDEGNECAQGDVVLIEQCKPISKTKSWKLVSIQEKATQV